MYAYFGASFRLLKSPMGPCTSYFVTSSRMFTVMSFNDRRRPKHTRSWVDQHNSHRQYDCCWSGSRVPRRRLSPSVGRWSSPTAVQFQWHAEAAHAANTLKKLGDRSFSAASPRLWNDLPPGLRRPGLTFDSFRQSLKTHLFGDRSAEWLFWMYRRYINKLIYLSIISNTQQHPTSWYTQTIAILSWHYFAAMSVALIDSCQTHYIQAGAPIPNSRDATLPFPPFPLSPLLTGVRGYKPHNFLELKTLVGEFQSISDIKINTFTIQGPALQNILRFVTWLS